MEKIGERRLAIKWIQFELINVEKTGLQLSIFDSQPEKLQQQIINIEKLFPGKILNFEQKEKTK